MQVIEGLLVVELVDDVHEDGGCGQKEEEEDEDEVDENGSQPPLPRSYRQVLPETQTQHTLVIVVAHCLYIYLHPALRSQIVSGSGTLATDLSEA